MKLHPMWQAYPTLQNDLSESLQLMEQSLKPILGEACLLSVHNSVMMSPFTRVIISLYAVLNYWRITLVLSKVCKSILAAWKQF